MAFSNRSQYPQTWFGRNKIWILSLSGLAVIVIIIVCATSFSSTEPGTTTTSIPIITSPSTSSTTTPSATTPKKQFNVTAPKGKLLVVTGSPGSNETASSEVIDLEDPKSKCQGMGSFPEKVYSAVGGFVKGVPLICGGYNTESIVYENICHTVGKEDGAGLPFNMTDARFLASSIVINEGKVLWITGGRDRSYTKLNTSNYVNVVGGSNIGPDLPTQLSSHCILTVNDSTVMVTGGVWRLEATWYYTFESGVWTSGPNMIYGRHAHVCGALKDSNNGKKITVAATGYTKFEFDRANSTELLIDGTDEWILGPELRSPGIDYATGTTSSDGMHFILAGGYDKHYQDKYRLYHLQCFDLHCVWTKMEQTMDVARAQHVAMLIPDEIANCTLQA